MGVTKSLPEYRVSVDIGGPFTDLVALNEQTGKLMNFKVWFMCRFIILSDNLMLAKI